MSDCGNILVTGLNIRTVLVCTQTYTVPCFSNILEKKGNKLEKLVYAPEEGRDGRNVEQIQLKTYMKLVS